MTLFLSERDLRPLLNMKEVVAAVEECFKRQGSGGAVNSPRTRSFSTGSVLNVMHASLPYLGRAGVKCYLSSGKGTRFVFVLFRLEDAEPLAVMGADMLGRFRTGAASAVATKYMHDGRSFRLAICGAGRQALTQVLAMAEVASLESVEIWSPHAGRRESLAKELAGLGVDARAHDSLASALVGAEVATTVTSSKDPFLTAQLSGPISHLNLCGSNSSARSEASPDCVGGFQTVAVDDLAQSKMEAGDLIAAEKSGSLSWNRVLELKDIVGGRTKPTGRTLFKSNGVATEDVATASLVYDKALRQGGHTEADLS